MILAQSAGRRVLIILITTIFRSCNFPTPLFYAASKISGARASEPTSRLPYNSISLCVINIPARVWNDRCNNFHLTLTQYTAQYSITRRSRRSFLNYGQIYAIADMGKTSQAALSFPTTMQGLCTLTPQTQVNLGWIPRI